MTKHNETPNDDVELAAYKTLVRIADAVERIAEVLEDLAEEELGSRGSRS